MADWDRPGLLLQGRCRWCCWNTSHVTRHTSHVTRHTSHVTRHTSHVTRHTSHVTVHTSHVTRHTSHVTRHTSHVTRHTSHVTVHTSHVTRHTSHVTRHTSHVTRHTSQFIGDSITCGYGSLGSNATKGFESTNVYYARYSLTSLSAVQLMRTLRAITQRMSSILLHSNFMQSAFNPACLFLYVFLSLFHFHFGP
jgi:hypothetical protein